MFGKLSLCILILIFGLFSLPAPMEPVQAQTSIPPTPRDSLVQVIQNRAQRDVELGKPAASISDLNLLFGKKAAEVGLPISEMLDIYEQAYKEATPPSSWYEPLLPPLSLVGLAALIILVIQNFLKDYLTKFFQWILTMAYNRLAGYWLFWRIALDRYRKALIEKYQKLNIPFRPGKPLDMKEVYVPLKAAEIDNAELIDAYQAINRHRRLMVVGAPGSGKSMLLRHIALTYARGDLLNPPTQSIPILIELNRLNNPAVSLEEHLVKTLEQNNFPHAGNFIKAGLKRGLLMLLFDGLDEVNSAERERVVNLIKDLLSTHPRCSTVITCRTAVYKEEFGDSTDQKLEIVEFSDQQVQRFLNSWEADLPPDKSVEHLLRNLRERPRIMALARNPLLLTIIAYLYADTEFVLPHSRAAFYNKSIGVLLRQWKEERNQYKSAHKQLVLQHLALFNQDSVQQSGQDQHSIELPIALAEIKKVLPSLTLKEEDAQPILDEIVERSGLLITFADGLKYQFAHLTLQEFFAAKALEKDTEGLIKCFKTDPAAWRETAKLWCGLPHDSTQLIREIYTDDAITAFECLGDAHKVDEKFANEVVTAFKKRLGEGGDSGEVVIRAFAIVATGEDPWGQQIYDFLDSTTSSLASSPELRLITANALALTNLPKAAKPLAQYAPDHPEVRPLLAQMGNLAVPFLEKWAGDGQIWSLDALQTIGTPQAAEVLVTLLWNANNILQYGAAWRLATLLPRPNIETTLSNYPLTPQQQGAEHLDWVWEPFGATATLRIIAGRIAYLLHTAPPDTIPAASSPPPDIRLVIPLCTVAVQEGGLKTLEKDKRERIEKEMKRGESVTVNPEDFSGDLSWRFLFGSLSAPMQVEVVRCLFFGYLKPNRKDWRNVFRPVEYEFKRSWQSKGIRLVLAITCLLNLWGIGTIIMHSPRLLSWGNGRTALIGILLVGALWFLGRVQVSLAFVKGVAAIITLLVGSMSAYEFMETGHRTIVFVIIGVNAGIILGVTESTIVSAIFPAIAYALIFAIGGTIGQMNGIAIGGTIGLMNGIAIGGAILSAINEAIKGTTDDEYIKKIVGVIGGVINEKIVGAIANAIVGAIVGAIFSPIVFLIAGAIAVGIGSIGSKLFDIWSDMWGQMEVAAFGLVWVIVYGLLWWHGARRQRAAQNPLKGLLETSMVATIRTPQFKFGWTRFIPGFR